MRHLKVDVFPRHVINKSLVCVSFYLIRGQLLPYWLGVVPHNYQDGISGKFKLALTNLNVRGLNKVEPAAHCEIAPYKALEECDSGTEKLIVRDVRKQGLLQVLTKRDCFKSSRNFDLHQWAELP